MAKESQATVMRPGAMRSSTFAQSTQPSLWLSDKKGIRQSRRPVNRMPAVTSRARLPVSSSSALVNSSGLHVYSPPSVTLKPASTGAKLQRRR